MSLVAYFIIFTLLVFSIGAYFMFIELNSIAFNGDSSKKGLEISPSKTNFNTLLFSSSKCNEDKENTVRKKIEIQQEIEKQQKQLKRNLRTLNYITLLQADVHIIKDPKRLEEINKLKEGIELQILKNTKILNKYKQLDINSI